ncbi:hypothetical protein TIFTF001_007170 [Ficus carica]|uniref:Uncharacterized protein n=1 Tax=Ficus carica TaxID=3494 RepID=A0AA87ZQJ4_FICCA|nr:hypothetical protein TIFTF001_007170 [Ficus carica]
MKNENTGSLVFRDGRNEGHEASAAEELGDEDGGVGLGLRGVDPLQALAEHAIVAAALSENPAAIAAHDLST